MADKAVLRTVKNMNDLFDLQRFVDAQILSSEYRRSSCQAARQRTHVRIRIRQAAFTLDRGADLEQQMKHESVSIVQMSRSREGLAGVKAFKDKVDPSFVGS